jgi:predicted PurR-regulated permease PerM
LRSEEPSAGLVVARVGAGLVLAAATYWVLRPFLVAMAWAAILAYVTWPLYRRVRDRTARPTLAAGLFTAGVAVALGLPLGWILVAIASEATHLVTLLRDWLAEGAPLPEWVTASPLVAARVEELRHMPFLDPARLGEYLARFGGQISSQLVDIASGVARNLATFILTLGVLIFFYLEGERMMVQVRRLAPVFFPHAPEGFLDQVGAVLRAVVFGLVGTALVQGVLAGIGLAVAGVPSPAFFGFATVILSFVPGGPPLVWGGATIWLFVMGHHAAAIGLLLWGALVVSSIDNVLRPILISGPTRIPFLLVFFGVLGGLAGFGLVGLFLGPVILSVAFTLQADFPRRRPRPG